MIPTEYEGTVAVDAAARKLRERAEGIVHGAFPELFEEVRS